MNDVKLLPLPETLLRSGFKSSIEVFARACIEADRKERVGGGEAAAWRRRHPSEDAPSGWHDWIVSSEKPCKEYPDSEYQPLYPHPAPPDVARLVEADKEFDAANEAWDALDTRSIGDYGDPRDYDGPEYERLWRAIERRKEALAPFTATQQEVQS